MKTTLSVIMASVLVFAMAATAHADDLRRAKRLRIAGWTTTAVGTAAFAGGLGYALAKRCDEASGTCDGDAAFADSLNGIFVMIAGFGVAAGAGLPMLLRARKLSQASDGRGGDVEVAIYPEVSGISIRGRF